MTDRPMDADATEHPDEGSIHAWLDDALDAAEAERLAAHVRTCVECQARVAEARGLIAGASRIVAALDDVPAGTRPQWAQTTVAEAGPAGAVEGTSEVEPIAQRSLWHWLRVTPGRAALAATILVAVGVTLTYKRAAIESTPRSAMVLNPQKADVPASTSPEGAASDAAKPRDELLDSAVAKNVTIAQGRRTIGAAPGPNVPAAPPPSTTLLAPPIGGAEAVARGRAAVVARRESTVAVADRLPVRAAPPADAGAAVAELPRPTTRGVAAAPSAAAGAANGAAMAKVRSDAVAIRCVRIDSQEDEARWADQAFPLVIAIDSGAAEGRRSASVLTVAGEPTQLRATWIPRGDSVLVRLGRIGYSGSIALGPDAGARSGVAVSAVAPTQLEQVVVEPAAPARAAAPRADARKAEAAARPTPPSGPPVRELHVTARVIACPSR